MLRVKRGMSFFAQKHQQTRKKIKMSEQGQPVETTKNDVAMARVMGCTVVAMVLAAILSMTIMMVAFLLFLSNLGSNPRNPVEYSAPY